MLTEGRPGIPGLYIHMVLGKNGHFGAFFGCEFGVVNKNVNLNGPWNRNGRNERSKMTIFIKIFI